MRSVRVSLFQIHDECSEFGKEVSGYLFRLAILHREILHIDVVGDKVESTVEMFGSLAACLICGRSFRVGLHFASEAAIFHYMS